MRGSMSTTEADSLLSTDEKYLCAKLQWLVNNVLVTDEGDVVQTLSEPVWGVTLSASVRQGTVMWSVFDGPTTRYLVFRGYAMGTLLPLPIPARRGKDKCIVNRLQFDAFRTALPIIEQHVTTTEKEVVASGYSVGTAPATLTAMHFASYVARVYVFSPFPFAESRFFARLSVPYTQIWLRGDSLVNCYFPMFRILRGHRRVHRAYKCFWTVFGYHSTQTIALTLAGDERYDLLHDMRRLARRTA